MFGPVRPTEFDVAFPLLGIPVRVLPWFWLVGVLLGRGLIPLGWPYLACWIVVLFFSVLVHEMGHALVAKAFGYQPRIFLHHWGGQAMFMPDNRYTSGRSILITLAGPGAGLLFGALIYAMWQGLLLADVQITRLADFSLNQFVWVNIVWSLLNLLVPVLPLDGGIITRDVCTSINPRRGEVWATWISIVVGAGLALVAFRYRFTFAGFIMALSCYQNYMALQSRQYRR